MDASLPGLWKTLKVGVGTALELSVSGAELGLQPGQRLTFRVLVERMTDGTRHTVQRCPDRELIAVEVPTADFAARHWRA